MRNPETNEVKSYSYNLTKEEVPRQQTKQEALNQRFMKPNDHFRRSIRRLSRNDYFFPTSGVYNLTCNKVPNDGSAGGRADEDFQDTSDFLLSSASRFSGRVKRESHNSSKAEEPKENYVCYIGGTDKISDSDLTPAIKKIYQTTLTKLMGEMDEFSLGNRFRIMSLNWPDSKHSRLRRNSSAQSQFMNASCKDSYMKVSRHQPAA